MLDSSLPGFLQDDLKRRISSLSTSGETQVLVTMFATVTFNRRYQEKIHVAENYANCERTLG